MTVGVGVVGVWVESVSGLFGVGQVIFVDDAFYTARQCCTQFGGIEKDESVKGVES